MKWLMYYLIVVNLLTWIIYGIDKWKAKRRAWRIPERTLLLLAAAGGCTGALAGMLMFRHKTCLLYTSPSPRDGLLSRMPSSA